MATHGRDPVGSVCIKGGGLFEFQTPPPSPPPPPDPPKVLEPVLLQFEILGERVGAEIFFFLPFLRGYIFFFTPSVFSQNTQNFVENDQKCLENTENFLTPDLTSGSDLG